MCSYTGYHFGASYPDAVCIDGYLWDLDSDDGDNMLTSGGDIPCPACAGQDWVHALLDTAANSFDTDITVEDQNWNQFMAAVLRSLKPHHSIEDIAAFLNKANPAIPYWQQGEDIEDLPAYELCWPFPLDEFDLSGHEKMTLLSHATPRPEATRHGNLWLRPLLD